jgi:trans-aconitate methyltransferase
LVSVNVWNADAYDEKLSFVSELGKSLVEMLDPKQGEKILDLGCGTGDLTNEIAKLGAKVVGMDVSPDMIEKARKKYPHLSFLADNGESFRTEERYDAIFSNAALHWMKRAESVVQSMALALREGGRLVVEFGGKGNVDAIVKTIEEVLFTNYGIDAKERNPWYFPSIGEYSSLLEKHGFRVIYAIHFDRPTPLPDGDQGLDHWLEGFAGAFFADFELDEKTLAYQKIKSRLKAYLWKDGVWIADYKRIRMIAVKEKTVLF